MKAQTAHLPGVTSACKVRVLFFLPPSKFPLDHPYGMDLDNLLKRFFDALQETVFRDAPGRDGCVTEIEVRKVKVASDQDAGAELEILGITTGLEMPRAPKSKTFLPDQLWPAHDLCMLNHDVMFEILRSGEEHGAFLQSLEFRDEADRKLFDSSAGVFEYLGTARRLEERALLLKRLVFPAVLSDFLHFVFEALETSRKAKLTATFALLRKPLQENMFLLELMVTNVLEFARRLGENPTELYSQEAGGIDVHTQRIRSVIDVLVESDRFDPAYLAQLRYAKAADDSFDGICNLAMHLFTRHKAIRTEPFNINFVFSDLDDKFAQWTYLYHRLPYLLFYTRRLVEFSFAEFAKTDQAYLSSIERRVAASTILWADELDSDWSHPAIEKFVDATRQRLEAECLRYGRRSPSMADLRRMRHSGRWPRGPSILDSLRGRKRGS